MNESTQPARPARSHDPLFDETPARDDGLNIDLLQYWGIVRKHLWSILALATVVGVLATLFANSLTPIYTATVTVIMERQAPKTLDYTDMYQYYQGRTDYLGTQAELLKSQSVVLNLVERLRLWEHSYFTERRPVRTGFNLSSLLGLFRSDERPVVEEDDLEAVKQDIIATIQGGIEVKPVQKSTVVNVTYSSDDPAFAALIANEIIESHSQANLEARFNEMQKATSWINERLGGLREQLQKSETALQNYRKRANIVDTGEEGASSLMAERLDELSNKLIQERINFNELRVLKRQADRYTRMSIDELLNTPAVYKHPALSEVKTKEIEASRRVEELSKRYGPKHPKMRQAIAELEANKQRFRELVPSVIRGIDDDYEVSRQKLAALQQEYDALKDEVRDVNVKEFELQKLESDVEADKRLLDIFLEEYKEANLTSTFETDQVRVVDPATVPASPVKPNKKRIIMAAIFAALILGVGLALLIELLDNTIKTSEDVERKLSLPTLGLLTSIDKKIIDKGQAHAERYYLEDDKSNFAETIRTVRTGITLSAIDDPHKTILFTSSVPGEGKTTTACNLALAMSQLEKTLIFDADMRRPSTNKIFGYDHQSPGMSELLTGEVDFKDIIHKVEGTNLYVITAGKIPPDPLDMLASKKFRHLLDEMCKRFDRVIIDSPPVSLVSDAILLSSMVDSVVFVVNYDDTNVKLINASVRKIKQTGAHITGVVVNRVDIKKMSRYYGYGYGKYYGSGYYSYGEEYRKA